MSVSTRGWASLGRRIGMRAAIEKCQRLPSGCLRHSTIGTDTTSSPPGSGSGHSLDHPTRAGPLNYPVQPDRESLWAGPP